MKHRPFRSRHTLVVALLAGCSGQIADPGPAGQTGVGAGSGSGTGGVGGGIGGGGMGGFAGGLADPSVLNCNGTRDVAPTPMRRLTRQEYANSVRDLLGVSMPSREDIPSDESAGPFATNTVTSVTDLATQQYMDSAEGLARAAVAKVDTLVGCSRPATADAACAAQFIDRFGTRAFRRPLAADEKVRYLGLYTSYAAGGFAEGIRLVVQAMLQSPTFLYHVELAAMPPAAGATAAGAIGSLVALDPFQVAARLSFFLWQSVPDDTLVSAASGGGLVDPASVRAQAERMLKDPRAGDAIASFHTQWLDLSKLSGLTKDTTVYPKFAAPVAAAMQAETVAFADHVLRNGDGRLETLLTAPYSILDGPLFDIYGVARPAGQTGAALVQLDPRQRAGLLTQGSFLATHAHQNQSSPVARGVAIRRNIMCQSLPDPPPDVNNTPPDPRPDATTRERLAEHQKNPTCGACHQLIDGVGLGFEAYDGIGAFRTTDQGKTINATGNIVGSADVNGPFDGAVALAQKLAASSEVQQCVARQWFRFALGRLETEVDGCSLKAVFAAFDSTRHDVRQLLTAIVTSDAFLYRRSVP